MIVVLAEVGDGDPFGPFFRARFQYAGRLIVGKVAAVAANAGFQLFGIRAVLEHVRVVVAFEIRGVELFDDREQAGKGVAQVGEDAELLAFALDDEGDAVRRVVRGADGMHLNMAKDKCVAGFEVANIVQFPEFAPCRRHRRSGNVNGQAKFPLQDAGALDVVGMVVRNDDAVHVANISAMLGHAPGGTRTAQTGVKQQTSAVGLDVDAIAIGAGLQGEGLHARIVSAGGHLLQYLYLVPSDKLLPMLDVDQALAIILAQCRALPTTKMALLNALHRTLAEPVATDIDQPPFNRSLMDGYAVRAAETAIVPVQLRVTGQIAAGIMSQSELKPGEAMQINTGAPIPTGADAVVRIERTQLDSTGEIVTVLESVKPDRSITPRAKYKRAGEVVLAAGSVLTPVNIGVCAAAGAAQVAVYTQPRVAVIVTGDELVDVGVRPGGGQIRNSNQYVLESLIRSEHCEAVVQERVNDDRLAIQQAIACAANCDVICITGGVSMGAFDFVPGALIELGATTHFHKISIKPGRPTLFATLPGGQLVFALPGNPVSAIVGFGLLVAPPLAALQGRPEVPHLLQAKLSGTLPEERDRQAYYPATLSIDSDGGYIAHLLSWHGSGDVLGMAGAEAFIVRPPRSPPAKDGDAVLFLPLA